MNFWHVEQQLQEAAATRKLNKCHSTNTTEGWRRIPYNPSNRSRQPRNTQRRLYEKAFTTQAACLYATQAHAWENTGNAQCPVETMIQHSHGGEFCVPIILTLTLALILPALIVLYLHMTMEGSASRAALKYQAFRLNWQISTQPRRPHTNIADGRLWPRLRRD